MLFREHRGTLAESMVTVKEFDTFEELKEHISKTYSRLGIIKDINLVYSCYDERINWDTYYVVIYFTKGSSIVCGMTNGNF